jgi:glycosyltransferase involved in cell wall biosynthesis
MKDSSVMSNIQHLDRLSESPSLVVIVCTYNPQRYNLLKEAIESLLDQSCKFDKLIVVASGSHALKQRIIRDYKDRDRVKLIYSEKSLSASQARNLGIKEVKADIIAFTDDDIVADKYWLENLLEQYQKTDAIAVGGRIEPIWLDKEPDYLPEELYWLVGATHPSFLTDEVAEIRNTFGPNMSFRKEVFDAIGGFNEQLGFADRGTSYIQGEEVDFSLRMMHKFGKGNIFTPKALINHKVPASKLKLSVFIKRSFFQGYTKVLIQKSMKHIDSILGPEKSYLQKLFLKLIPKYFAKIFTGPERCVQVKKFTVLIICLGAAGLGFAYGHLKHIR